MTPFEHLTLAAISARRGRSLVFDGSFDVVDLGVIAALNYERTDSFSVAAWVKLTSSGFEPIIGNLDAAPTFKGWELAIFQGKPWFDINNTNLSNGLKVQSNTLVNDGLWHHVMVTYAGTSLAGGVEFYVDGALTAKTTVQTNLAASIVPATGFLIGGRLASQEDYVGKIHEVAVYDAVLSGANVTAIYNGGKRADLTAVGPFANLVGNWKRTPLDGFSYPTFPDVSGAGNHGTMTNMAPDDITQDSPP